MTRLRTLSLLCLAFVITIVLVACAEPREVVQESAPEPVVSVQPPGVAPEPAPEIAAPAESTIVSVEFLTGEAPVNHIFCDDFLIENSQEKIIITTNAPVSDFEYIEVGIRDFGDGIEFYGDAILYALFEFTPDTPFVATWQDSVIPGRAIGFTDETGIFRYFLISVSGLDGSLQLTEIELAPVSRITTADDHEYFMIMMPVFDSLMKAMLESENGSYAPQDAEFFWHTLYLIAVNWNHENRGVRHDGDYLIVFYRAMQEFATAAFYDYDDLLPVPDSLNHIIIKDGGCCVWRVYFIDGFGSFSRR